MQPHLRWRWRPHSTSVEQRPRSSGPPRAVSTGSISLGRVPQGQLLLPSPDLDSDLTSTHFHSSPPPSPTGHSNNFHGRQWRPSRSRPTSSRSRLPGSSRYEDTLIRLLTISLLDLFLLHIRLLRHGRSGDLPVVTGLICSFHFPAAYSLMFCWLGGRCCCRRRRD
jgi:hypothetical protein